MSPEPAAVGPPPEERLPSLLDAETFVARFAGAAPFNRSVRALQKLLAEVPVDAPLPLQLDWLEDLFRWVHQNRWVPGASPRDPWPTGRLRFLLHALSELPTQVADLRRVVRQVLERTNAVRLFTDTGLPSEGGFFSEGVDRLARSVLPEAPAPVDLAQLVHRMFPSSRAARWFEQLPQDLVWEAASVMWGPPGDAPGAVLQVIAPAMRHALTLLSARVAALGVADEMRERLPEFTLEQMPFLRLPRAVEAFLTEAPISDKPAAVVCRETIADCRRAVRAVVSHTEEAGVSIKLLFRLEIIVKSLDRMYMLLSLLAPGSDKLTANAGLRLFTTLVRGGIRDRSLADLLQTNVRVLARRVIERNGHGGEHYITSDAREYHQMVNSAAGGGAITAFTALLKFLITWGSFAVFFEGLFLALNYSVSFVVMQLAGFSLGTKQPAMTAAALAGAIKETANAEEPDLAGLVNQVARLVRSQLAAIGGNLGMVIPCVVLVDFAVQLALGRGVLDAHAAQAVVAKHHPLHSASIFYAVLTGFILWAGSLFAGGVENWAVYRRLPEALAAHRWSRRLLGPARAQRLSHAFLHNVGGVGGSVALGTLLGVVPSVGKVFGLALDVRHITLSAGALTFAAVTYGPTGVVTGEFLSALLGLAIIGVLNLGVSFSLALAVALRARGVGALGHVKLVQALLGALWRSPAIFFVPPPEPPSVSAK